MSLKQMVKSDFLSVIINLISNSIGLIIAKAANQNHIFQGHANAEFTQIQTKPSKFQLYQFGFVFL